MKLISTLLIFLCFCSIASATDINIYYPNNNTTTDIYYGNDTGYYSNTSNYLDTTGVSVVLLKNQIVTDDNVLDNPRVIYEKLLIIIWVIVIVFIVIIMAKLFSGVLK